MKVVLTRVRSASVSIAGEVVGAIGQGYLLLSGFAPGDTAETVSRMAEKIHKLRIFEDEGGKTNLSIDSVHGNVLSISQFTLYGDLAGGNRPSFFKAMDSHEAERLYLRFNDALRSYFPSLQEGRFGADMEVSSLNDGPFTLVLDSEELFGGKR